MSKELTNILIDGLTGKGFILPEGYTWDMKLKNGLKEGKVTVRNKVRMVHAILEYKNDKLNGICCFFYRGSPKEKITFVNDIAEGWGCEIEKGKEIRWFIYKNGIKEGELIKFEKKDGYWNHLTFPYFTLSIYERP